MDAQINQALANRHFDIEMQLLLDAIYLKYHCDFRGYAGASLKRRLATAMIRLGCDTLSQLQDKVLHDASVFPALMDYLTVQVSGGELLMAVTLTAFGVFVASHIQRMEGFSVVMQLLLFPMLFLSGTLFPLTGLPGWLTVLTRINPLTYAVAPLRDFVFAVQHMPPAAAAKFSSAVTLFGATLSNAACIGITCAFTVAFLALAITGFGQPD